MNVHYECDKRMCEFSLRRSITQINSCLRIVLNCDNTVQIVCNSCIANRRVDELVFVYLLDTKMVFMYK